MEETLPKNATLPERMRFCVKHFGKQKDFVAAVNFSRAQLNRYLRGDASPPISVLEQIAAVSQVSLCWLVTGEGEPLRKVSQHQAAFKDALLEKVICTFEETLMEYRGVFTPTQKSILLPLIYKAIIHERMQSNETDISKYEMHWIIYYMEHMVKNETLTVFRDAAYHLINKDSGSKLPDKDLSPFDNVTCKATAHYFSSPMGETYFDRTRGTLNQMHRTILNTVMEHIFKILGNKPLKMVDIGCGSGRHLAHIAHSHPQVEVNGIELSELPYQLCKEREASGSLPEGTVIRGDIHNLPYPSESMDFVTAIAVFHYLLHVPELSVGVNRVLQEVHRILKPGGLLYCDMRHGKGREYTMFNQKYTLEGVKKMAANNHFDVIWVRTDELGNLPNLSRSQADAPEKYKDFIAVLLRKKAGT